MFRRGIHSRYDVDDQYSDCEELTGRRSFCNSNEACKYANVSVKPSQSNGTYLFTAIARTITWIFYCFFKTQSSIVNWICRTFHRLASRVVLMDTLILNKRQKQRKIRSVIWLSVIPLLLFGVWWFTQAISLSLTSNIVAGDTVELVEPVKIEEPTELMIEKILNDPRIQNVLNMQFASLKTERNREVYDKNLIQTVAALREELKGVKRELQDRYKNEDLNRVVSKMRVENSRNQRKLTNQLKKWWLNDPEFHAKQNTVVDQMKSLFLTKDELEERLANLHPVVEIEGAIEAAARQVMERVGESVEDVKKIVKKALDVYDADKTGLVDYAMGSSGGEVVTKRCTESYRSGKSVISVLGIPVWSILVSPQVVITPGAQPGECWAFQDFPGLLVIKLSKRINVESFSMEHVSRLLVPEGKIDSAPRDFEVLGLDGVNDNDPTTIGQYTYDANGDAIQFFAAQNRGHVFDMVEIRIKSNHGNPNYTCLYRFRVHGRPEPNIF